MFDFVTITTDCRVAAFRRPDTSVVYILFERAAKRTVVPSVARWTPRAIGAYQAVLPVVFALAASCEDGSRQGPRGYMRPEDSLRRWSRAFQAPLPMPDLELTLEVGDRRDAPIPRALAGDALAAIRACGRGDVADALLDGPVSVRLHRDAELLIALYGVPGMPLWPVMNVAAAGKPSAGRPEMAPASAHGGVTLPRLTAYRPEWGHVVLALDDGPFVHYGFWYQALKRYMLDVLCASELRHSGLAAREIRVFRTTCNQAPALPPNTVVKVPWRDADGPCAKALQLAVALGIEDDRTEEAFTFAFRKARGAALEHLLALPAGHARWDIPGQQGGDQSGG